MPLPSFRASPFATRLALLAVVAAVVSVAVYQLVYPTLSWNRDEPVYLWHIEVLASGRLDAPLGEPVDAFRPWLSGVSDDAYFSQYTLGWPLVLLAAELAFGTAAGAIVGGTVLAVVGATLLARELLGSDRAALAVGVAFLATPAVVIQSGVHLSYLFTTGTGYLALTAGLAGLRRRRTGWVVLSGLALGWILITRPFDAVLWGGVLAVGAVLRHRWRGALTLWPAVVAGLPFVVWTIAYNLRITGEALTFPIVAADPLDTFGFGEKRLMPALDSTDYDLGQAAYSSFKNAGFFVVFLAGNVVTVALAAFGAWRRRARPETWILVVLGAAFPVGYFFFWGTFVSSLTARLVGPIYSIPAIAAMLALAVSGAAELRRVSRPAMRTVVAVAVVLTVPVLVNRVWLNHDISEKQQPWLDSVAALDEPSLVFVASSGSYLLFGNPLGPNGPDLDDEVLYAVDLGPRNLDTIEANPGRTPYLQLASAHIDELQPKEDTLLPEVEVVPMEVVEGTSLTLVTRYTPLDGDPVVVPFVEVDGEVTHRSVEEVTTDANGQRSVTWIFTTTEPTGGEVRLPAGPTVARVGFGSGADVAEAMDSPIIQWELDAVVEGGSATFVLPVQQFVRFPVGEVFRWYPRPGYPGAASEVSVGS